MYFLYYLQMHKVGTKVRIKVRTRFQIVNLLYSTFILSCDSYMWTAVYRRSGYRLSLSYLPHASTVNDIKMGRAPSIRMVPAKNNSDESDNVDGCFRAAKTQVSTSMRRHASLEQAFLETLILIPRCENYINVTYVGDVRPRRNDHQQTQANFLR